MVQGRAIAEGKDEIITIDLIHEVAKEGFYLVKPMLEAIRSGDTEWMNKYKDIAPLNTVEYQNKSASKLESKDLKEIRRLASKKQEKRSPLLHAVILKLIEELEVEPALAKLSAEAVVNKNEDIDIKTLVKDTYLIAHGVTSTPNLLSKDG